MSVKIFFRFYDTAKLLIPKPCSMVISRRLINDHHYSTTRILKSRKCVLYNTSEFIKGFDQVDHDLPATREIMIS